MNTTVIIPTKNRKNFLLRTLNYYSKKNIGFKVIVVDSSEKKLEEKEILKYKFLRYFHINLSVTDAVIYALENLETEFVIYQGDEDIFFPDNLNFFENIILENKDIVAVGGEIIGYELSGDKAYGRLTHKSSYTTRKIMNSNSFLRLKNICDNYYVPLFYLMRKDDLLKFYQLSKKVNIPEYCGEISQVFMLAFKGKIYLEKSKVFMFRQFISNNTKLYGMLNYFIKDTSVYAQLNEFYKSWYDEIYQSNNKVSIDKFKNFLKKIDLRYSVKEYYGKNDIFLTNKIIDLIFSTKNYFWIINNKIIKFFVYTIKNLYKKFYYKYSLKKIRSKNLEKKNIIKFFNDNQITGF